MFKGLMTTKHRRRWRRLIAPGIVLSGSSALAGPYSSAGGQSGSTAISASSSSIVEWASGAAIVRGLRDVENPTEYSSDPSSPLNFAYYGGSDGASTNASNASIAAGQGSIASTTNTAPIGMPPQPQSAFYAVALGQNGSATLTFNQPITNGPGPDFAVFGNGFSSGSQEWVKPASVEVSSNGVNFFSFPSVSLTQTSTQVGDYDELDPTNLYDIAGKDPAGWGTPFDLSELAGVSPLLNVNAVTEVRIVGISGDINPAYATRDSKGNIINAPYPAASQAGSEGFGLAGVGVLNELAGSTSSSLLWSNAAGTGVWNIAGDANWNVPGVMYPDGSNVTFDNSIFTSNQTVTLNGLVSPTSVTVNNSTGSYTITGSGGINGSTGLTKWGSQKLVLATVNTYTGATAVNGGILELAVAGALPAGSTLTVAAGAEVVVDSNTGLVVLSGSNLSLSGKLDLSNNGLVVHNGNLATITAAINAGSNDLAWNGTSGITSSTAAADTSHLTALGVMLNINAAGNPVYTASFDGTTGFNLTSSDVLVRYTYYGDANLDGHVDGSDYSLIDNGFLDQLTGWQNGDFNYDGIVNGSDYTLIDNAYNNQGAALAASVAADTAEIAVPEPTALGLIAAGAIPLLRRRKAISFSGKRHQCDTDFQPVRETSDFENHGCQETQNDTHGPEAGVTLRGGRSAFSNGFTIVELLVVIGIISVLTAILLPTLYRARQQSQLLVCASNIRQLALANILYAGDNRSFCAIASSDIFDDLGDGEGGHYRWDGTRSAAGQPFNPALGPLAPYLGRTGTIQSCPVFDPTVGDATGNNFEAGSGGYGYNEVYIGGRMDVYGYTPQAVATSAKIGQIMHSAETVMFTDSGMAQPVGTTAFVTEYSFCEPPFDQENPGNPSTDMAWPSIHFRHRGRANVAWADGHVSNESLTFSNESYGLTPQQVAAANVGWFGPRSNHLFQISK